MHFKAIILDFDGTMMRLFCNYNLKATVLKMSEYLKALGFDFSLDHDAFDVFSYIDNLDIDLNLKHKLLEKTNSILVAAELEALNTGVIIPGTLEYLDYLENNQIFYAIASNNSKEVIEEFFKRFRPNYKPIIIGRSYLKPSLMKPNTYMLNKLYLDYSLNKEDMVFIGDNPRDYECAKNFSISFIGITPTEGKRIRMENLKADFKIYDDFNSLVGER